MDSFLSRTVAEVLGQFRPGGESIVFASDATDADIVAAHERAHKALTIATSFGRYLSALVTAMPDQKEEAHFDELRARLEFGIEQCWVVQEAYATASQLLYAESRLGPKAASESKASLPPAYRAALDSFPDVRDAVREALSSYPCCGSPAALDAIASDVTRACLSVVAGAAMSVPVSRFFVGSGADLSGFNAWIRRNAPDGRLPLLVQYSTRQMVAEWADSIFRVTLQSIDLEASRPRDDFIASASAALCTAAGLSYEPSDAVDIQSILRAIGSDVQITEVDLRSVPLDTQSDYFNSPVRLAPHHTGMAWYIEWRDAITELHAFRKIYPGAVTTVVCEVMYGPERDEIWGALHLFVPYRFAGLGSESGAADKSVSRPARVLSVPFRTNAVSLALLAGQFPNRAWCWLGYQEMISRPTERLTHLLAANSTVVYAVPTLVRYRDLLLKNWVHVALPRTESLPCWRVAGAPPGWEPAALLIPQGTMLAYRDHTEPGATFRLVELLAATEFLCFASDASYLDDCVAQALAFGHYSLFLRIANEF